MVWGWSGVVWDNMHSFLHVLDLSGRWSQVVWVVLGWSWVAWFVSARSKVVWDSQGSGAVWGGLGWSGLLSTMVWGGLGKSGVVWARFCMFWGGLGWSGLVSACCKVVWGGLRARAGLGSFQHVVGSSGVDWNGWELSGVVRVRFCSGLE